MHPNVLMHSVERAADGTRSSSTSTLEQLVARVEGSEQVLTERMFDPEVRVSGDLAMVWTAYDFYVGDEFSHCGRRCVRAHTFRRFMDGRVAFLDAPPASGVRIAPGGTAQMTHDPYL